MTNRKNDERNKLIVALDVEVVACDAIEDHAEGVEPRRSPAGIGQRASDVGTEALVPGLDLALQLGISRGSTREALRVLAAEFRNERMMRAEEKAHRLPVLISIPLVACMLPTMIGVLMLPAFIRVIRTLLPAMAGEAP